MWNLTQEIGAQIPCFGSVLQRNRGRFHCPRGIPGNDARAEAALPDLGEVPAAVWRERAGEIRSFRLSKGGPIRLGGEPAA